MTVGPDDVLAFWYGELNEDGTAKPEVAARWWKKDDAFDEAIRARFGETHASAARGELDGWAATPRGRVALVIVLDQFSRNLHRGSPDAFANDDKALALAREGVERGEHRTLSPLHAYFLVMPFMHAEDSGAQARCCALFRELAEAAPNEALEERFANGADYAERHRVIVDRFGRFPHRNDVLGRESTDEERDFLKQPGSSF